MMRHALERTVCSLTSVGVSVIVKLAGGQKQEDFYTALSFLLLFGVIYTGVLPRGVKHPGGA